tara:strand:+ start:114 stop:860 length:747 start_codon:yes stop_codon:yes gene_type:complete
MKINNPWVLIPENVLKDPNLTFREKIMYSKILALDNGEEHCYANNHYFSELLGVGKVSISRIINGLVKKNYIKINNPQSKHRRIKICTNLLYTNGQSNNIHMYKQNNNNKNNNKTHVGLRILHFKSSMIEAFKDAEMPVEEQEKFLEYWCELNSSGNKFRREKEEFFDEKKRVKTWMARVQKWNNKKANKIHLTQFKRDSAGFPIGWCGKCGKSDFYTEFEIFQDSRCCGDKLFPHNHIERSGNGTIN